MRDCEIMPTPIFIIGNHRSGTTWLANILCANAGISGIQSEKHYGIHESIFFSNFDGRYGNLENYNNFIEFAEVFSATDYFQLTGLDKEFIYKNYKKDYYEIFKSIMEVYAKNNNSIYWLEKSPSHTLYLERIMDYFPNAKFIAIKRNIIDVIKSTKALSIKESRSEEPKKIGKIHLLKWTIKYVLFDKIIDHYLNNSKISCIIHYEQIRKNPDRISKLISRFLELNIRLSSSKIAFNKNTSFNNETRRKKILSTSEIIFIKFFQKIFEFIPFYIYSIYIQHKIKDQGKFPTWVFSFNFEKINKR